MIRPVLIAVCLPAVLWAGGCRHQTTVPMPGVLQAAGLLLRCERIRLTADLELRRFEQLRSDMGNEFYPFNVSRAAHADWLVSKLYVRRGGKWQLLDYVEMPLARPREAVNLSRDGRRIIYDRPDVAEGEGEFPRAYPRDRRSYHVAIYDHAVGRRFLLEGYSGVYGLGAASYWRPDGQAAAITTTSYVDGRPCRQLAILDACGNAILNGQMMPTLKGLEFICYSPDGTRLAALRPVRPRSGGRQGGMVVEVDPAGRTVRKVGEIPSALACRHLGRFDRLVTWDADGRCRLAD